MIKHIKCDIFESGADIICHQVNCQGVMGSGIAKQVRQRFPNVYEAYMETIDYARSPKQLLGFAQPCSADLETKTGYDAIIMNLFAQETFGYDGKCYTDYDALRSCFEKVKDVCHSTMTVALPYKIGCARGGGDWNIVYKIIEEVFSDSDCDVLICEYNGG
jgi:O-acetyl-ADP-ribose deacetylase (regulator of RNase III)